MKIYAKYKYMPNKCHKEFSQQQKKEQILEAKFYSEKNYKQ